MQVRDLNQLPWQPKHEGCLVKGITEGMSLLLVTGATVLSMAGSGYTLLVLNGSGRLTSAQQTIIASSGVVLAVDGRESLRVEPAREDYLIFMEIRGRQVLSEALPVTADPMPPNEPQAKRDADLAQAEPSQPLTKERPDETEPAPGTPWAGSPTPLSPREVAPSPARKQVQTPVQTRPANPVQPAPAPVPAESARTSFPSRFPDPRRRQTPRG